ncbi:30S ribosome-binding factor RbfA [Kitasatospora aureofaciens]|uniref:Ribosome-binding factor A n=1 Tax=Kitasatospora aureofaciens TaxID=1894 RepID=A0A1E7MZE5_KITAU|nr:30S ribosome-binding factor RbfA [Kitasatospora aureofaciens]QEV01582.1 30S ribosome-binding factor RbfA [Streptomyces viridifaciens]ARF80336.1 ribosome-binding factor A [Kitasatospora aureofaciens]OEV33825.1 ribosome-binding factor A [Kitasatospora aureofaciens]UKZ07999.1 30S ribosome-binding factor RbfA [Streptomyces viridifaciens]GGV02202.1 ribosome-binding factor A [Kitasatospora aureofaciens]
MTDTARARKLADRIQVVVAQTLERRIKDPRLGFVTITDTRVTGDLREATVFYTVFGDETDREATAAALESAKGVIRSEVGKIGVRFTPTLTFVADALPENARNIDDLLDRAKAIDAAVRTTAAGATYAGDADPYRVPASERDDEDE